MKKLSLYRVLPSLVTTTSFIFGFNAIIFAINGAIEKAIYALLISGVLDVFDGRLARLLRVQSKFGAELDSLSDFVCFGVATAFIVLFFQDHYSSLLLVAVTFFAVCAMLRLARFNIDTETKDDQTDDYKDDDSKTENLNYFVGVPTPAAFVLAILPIAIYYVIGIGLNTIAYSVYIIVVGFLMVATIPTPSLKSIIIPRRFLAILLGFVAFLIILFIKYTWHAIIISVVIYLTMMFYIWISFLKKENR